MANPTLPQYAEFCLQTILENWSGYYHEGIKKVRDQFKFMNQILGGAYATDGNTVYCFFVTVLSPLLVTELEAKTEFDAGCDFDGTLVINPIDPTLDATITIGDYTYTACANTGKNEFHNLFGGIQNAVAVNCDYWFEDGVAIKYKA